MKIKTLYFVLFACLLSVGAYAQRNGERPYFTKDFSENYLESVKVQTSGGGISVTGDQQSGVRVEMYVRANNGNGSISDDEIEERLKDYAITIRRENNQIVAIAEPKDRGGFNWKKGLSISFKVFTPRNFNTELRTSGGGINLSSLTGDQNFTTSGGGIDVDNLKGKIRGRTSGGGIKATRCSDNIDLITSGGGIQADDMIGNIRLVTSGGGLDLANLEGKIEATTSGGGVRAERIRGELDTRTSGGSIQLKNMAASVKATTSAGSIDADFDQLGDFISLNTSAGSVRVSMPLTKGMDLDLRGNRVSIPLRNFDGRSDKDRVQGSLNGGGISVKLTASSGNVSVNQ